MVGECVGWGLFGLLYFLRFAESRMKTLAGSGEGAGCDRPWKQSPPPQIWRELADSDKGLFRVSEAKLNGVMCACICVCMCVSKYVCMYVYVSVCMCMCVHALCTLSLELFTAKDAL